jgi:hypothetical protein
MPEDRPPFVIHVDGRQFKVEKLYMSGAELKALVGKDSTYQLFQELPGNEPDRLISDTDSVKMSNGLLFYTVPPATFGGRWH